MYIKYRRKEKSCQRRFTVFYLVTVVPGMGFKHVKWNTTLQKIEFILTIYPLSFLRETIVYN